MTGFWSSKNRLGSILRIKTREEDFFFFFGWGVFKRLLLDKVNIIFMPHCIVTVLIVRFSQKLFQEMMIKNKCFT